MFTVNHPLPKRTEFRLLGWGQVFTYKNVIYVKADEYGVPYHNAVPLTKQGSNFKFEQGFYGDEIVTPVHIVTIDAEYLNA